MIGCPILTSRREELAVEQRLGCLRCRTGLWDLLSERLLAEAHAAGDISWELLFIDGSIRDEGYDRYDTG